MRALAKTAFPVASESSQQRFHRCWDHLVDPHLRALAWLLDSSDLLDAQASCWQGKIATLHPDMVATAEWLRAQDGDPGCLHAALDLPGASRLGRYAERLMVHYFAWCGSLAAHGLQIQTTRNNTVGEFDFLLREGSALVHYEFATKFYLFESADGSYGVEHLIGPNLADTLDAKMRKILDRQLALGTHPAAQAYLPQPIDRAQAVIKGWLFYPDRMAGAQLLPGVARAHCRGFWCSIEGFGDLAGDAYAILPRLAWLAPARIGVDQVHDQEDMAAILRAHFARESAPVMVALMRCNGSVAREETRGFIVPDDWPAKVHVRNRRTVLHGDA